jgi:ankyrin repeat protein
MSQTQIDRLFIKTTKENTIGELTKPADIGADVNAGDQNRRTALMWACLSGRLEIVKILIQRKANVNAKDFFQSNTPLMVASSGNHVEIARLLLQNGAKVNIREGVGGWTALMMAAHGGCPEIVKLLIAEGADVNLTDLGDRYGRLHCFNVDC